MPKSVKAEHHSNVEMTYRRCYSCGRYYAFEEDGPGFSGACGRCMYNSLQRARDTVAQRDLSIAALKGVITKMKAR